MVDQVLRTGLTIAGAYFFGPIGAIVGSAIGGALFPVQLADVKGPRIKELAVQRGTVGAPIPIVYGTKRIAGNVIFESDLIEEKQNEEHGGKGGAPSQTVTTWNYFIDIRIGLCDGEDGRPSKPQGIRRIWAYGDLIYDLSPQADDETDDAFAERLATSEQTAAMMTIFDGAETQLPSTMIESYKGVGNVPAYRGLYSVEFAHFPLAKYGNAVPSFTFELYTGTATEEDCSGYSAGELYPWQYMLNAATFDPRNPANAEHLYHECGFSTPTLSYDAAMAAMNLNWGFDTLPGTPSWVLGEIPQGVDAPYVRGWTHGSSTPNWSQPCDADDPSAPSLTRDSVTVGININTIRADPYSCRVNDSGGDDYGCSGLWIEFGDVGIYAHFNAGDFSGFATLLSNTVAYPTDAGLPPGPWDKRGSSCNPPGAPSNIGWWAAFDQEMCCRRYWAPRACHGGTAIAGAPGFCIIDGVVRRELTWSRVASGTFKSLRRYFDNGAGGVVSSYPLDPTLRSDHPLYNDEDFWTNAYNEAVADPSIWPPLPTDWVYGVDYPYARAAHPTNLSSAAIWESSCTAMVIDPECVPMAAIVADICDRAGMDADQYDADGLTSCVMGYAVTRPMSARDALSPLRMFGLWDCVESAGVLRFVERGGAIVQSITTDELGVSDATEARSTPSVMEVTRLQEKDLPRRVRLHYEDIDHAHEPGEQSASRLATEATDEIDIELAISMTATDAAQLAEILLYDFWTSRNAYRLTLDNGHSRLEPADVIEIPVDGETERVRITAGERAIGGILAFECVRDDDEDYVSTAVPKEHDPSGPPGHGTPALVCPSEMILLDLPSLRETDTDCGYYAAIAGMCDSWECAAVYRSADGGATYSRIARTDQEATLGDVDSVTAFDATGPLTVTLRNGTLESVTPDQVALGFNHAAVGAHGRWCIVSFETATLVSGSTWELTGLEWGLNDTDANIGTTATDDDFVLLDYKLLRLPESVESLAVEKLLKVVTCGEGIDDVTAQTFATSCLSYEPPITGAPGGPVVIDPDTGEIDLDPTVPLDNVARVGVRKNSTGSTYERRRINLIEGTNVTFTVADDATDEEIDVTINAPLGSKQTMRGAAFLGGGVALLPTVPAVHVHFPRAGTITRVVIYGDFPGSATIEIKKQPLSTFAGDTAGATIVGADPPTVSGAYHAEKTSFTGWTLAFVADTMLSISLTTVSGFTKLTVEIFAEDAA